MLKCYNITINIRQIWYNIWAAGSYGPNCNEHAKESVTIMIYVIIWMALSSGHRFKAKKMLKYYIKSKEKPLL